MKSISESNLPAQIVVTGIEVTKSLIRYANGEITIEQLSEFVVRAQKEYDFIELNNKSFSYIGAKSLGWLIATGLVGFGIHAIIVTAKANTNLDKALSNLAKAGVYKEETQVIRSMCFAIIERSDMYNDLLIALGKAVSNFTDELRGIYSKYGTDYRKLPKDAQDKVAMALSTAKAIVDLLEVDILDEQGKLTEVSLRIWESQKEAYDVLSDNEQNAGGVAVDVKSRKVIIKI